MKRLLESTRYVTVIGVVTLLAAALATFAASMLEAYGLILGLFAPSLAADAIVGMITLVDHFLIATTLLVFALSLYELFIGDLDLPAWLVVHNLHDLKAKLGGVVVLVMAVKFVEKLADWKAPLETLWFALAIAVVAAVLIAFTRFDDAH